MNEVDPNQAGWIVEALLPSVPPTLTAIAGFFVFHFLAMRRQRREEVRQACDAFKEGLSELTAACAKCWEVDAAVALTDGKVSEYKAKIFSCDLRIGTLKSAQPGFDTIATQYRTLKKAMDEYREASGWVSIEGEGRMSNKAHANALRSLSAKLGANADRRYFELYR